MSLTNLLATLKLVADGPTNGRTNQPTNQPTDRRTLSRIELLSQLKIQITIFERSYAWNVCEFQLKLKISLKHKQYVND